MKKKKIFYLLSILLVFSLVLTGCGGGDSGLPNDGNGDDEETTAEATSISGEFTFPEDDSSAEVNSLNNDEDYTIVVENFDTGNSLDDLNITFLEENKYKVSGIETGQDIVINIIRTNDNLKISTFIPEVTKEDENDETVGNSDPATTILTAIVKKQKEKAGNVELTRKQVKERKSEIDDVTKDINSKYLKDIIKDVEEESVETSDEITETIANVKEKIQEGYSKANAKKMVDFVRNSGMFVERTAENDQKTITDSMKIVGNEVYNFANDFETQIGHLFTANFIYNEPGDDPIHIDDINHQEIDFSGYPETNEWEWTLVDDNNNTVDIRTTNLDEVITQVAEEEYDLVYDLRDLVFEYNVNSDNTDYYFEGLMQTLKEETSEDSYEKIVDYGDQTVKFILPKTNRVKVLGEFNSPELNNVAQIDFTLANALSQDESNYQKEEFDLNGTVKIEELFTFTGDIYYMEERDTEDLQGRGIKFEGNIETFLDNSKKYEIKYEDGTSETITPDKNVDLELARLYVESVYNDNLNTELLNSVEIEGIVETKPTASEWESRWIGELSLSDIAAESKENKDKYFSLKFTFEGSLEHVDYADLGVSLQSDIEYDDVEKTGEINSDLKVERGGKYLDGTIDSDLAAENFKVELENENHAVFTLVKSNDEYQYEESNVRNAKGEAIADIQKYNESPTIFYPLEDGSEEFETLF